MQTFASKTEEGINIIVQKTKQILNKEQLNKDKSYYDPHDFKESFDMNREMVDKSSECLINVVQPDSAKTSGESSFIMIN